MAISNTDEVFENHMPWVRKTHVVIEYCKPVYINSLDKETRKVLNTYVQDIIRQALDKNASLI